MKISKQKLPLNLKIENITNIKNLNTGINELMCPYKIICDKIIKEMINIDNLKFLKFRDYLYDIFIYNLDITDCIWYIITSLINQQDIKSDKLSLIMSFSNCPSSLIVPTFLPKSVIVIESSVTTNWYSAELCSNGPI